MTSRASNTVHVSKSICGFVGNQQKTCVFCVRLDLIFDHYYVGESAFLRWVGCVVRLWLCGCAGLYIIYDYSLLLKYLNPNLMLLVLGLSTAVLHTLHMHIYLTYIHTHHT